MRLAGRRLLKLQQRQRFRSAVTRLTGIATVAVILSNSSSCSRRMVAVYRVAVRSFGMASGTRHEYSQMPPHPYFMVPWWTMLPDSSRITSWSASGGGSAR